MDGAAAAEVADAIAFAMASDADHRRTTCTTTSMPTATTCRAGASILFAREEAAPSGETKAMGMQEAVVTAQDLALGCRSGRVPAGRGYRRSAGRRVQDQRRPGDQMGQGARAPHPDRGAGDHRRGDRRRAGGHAPGRRADVLGFHRRDDGPDRQPRRQAALYVGQRDACADDHPHHDVGRDRRLRRAAQPVARSLAAACAGSEDRLSLNPARRARPVDYLHLRRGSLRPPGIDAAQFRRAEGGGAAGRLPGAVRRRQGPARGQRHLADLVRLASAASAWPQPRNWPRKASMPKLSICAR